MDDNQAEIVSALRRIGARVTSLAGVGNGVPDLLVWYRGRWLLIEVKNRRGRGNKLTSEQAEWHSVHADALVFIVTSVEEAIRAVTS